MTDSRRRVVLQGRVVARRLPVSAPTAGSRGPSVTCSPDLPWFRGPLVWSLNFKIFPRGLVARNSEVTKGLGPVSLPLEIVSPTLLEPFCFALFC